MDIPRAVLELPLLRDGDPASTRARRTSPTARAQLHAAAAARRRGLISPWNLPLYLLSWKIAPAIAAGNTCVAKPSELTPLTAHRLASCSLEAGCRRASINIVHGYGAKAGAAICEHPDVAAISFTGGTVTGAKVAAARRRCSRSSRSSSAERTRT
jgi:aminomuconate-semialdehyde/2-hydroxymuconate-6-semialdehyde dehydrogenase